MKGYDEILLKSNVKILENHFEQKSTKNMTWQQFTKTKTMNKRQTYIYMIDPVVSNLPHWKNSLYVGF